jgi:hypothetical protein
METVSFYETSEEFYELHGFASQKIALFMATKLKLPL